jgi:endonuclease/exonuclease/phosphatase family metal-dependent hydrolase
MCRIVSYNIHSGIGRDGKRDYARIGQFLAETGADIVLLQEMDTRPEVKNTAQDIEDICAGNVYSLLASPALEETHGWYGNAILTRFKVLHTHRLDVSQAGRQPRNVQIVTFQTEQGPLTVVNTHKGLKKKERRSQFNLLHDFLSNELKNSDTPLVLAGDFNEWQFFTRAFRKLNTLLNQRSLGATFPSQFPIFSLDRVWVSNNIEVIDCKKLKTKKTRYYSDHLPVQLDIRLPDTPRSFV